MAQVLAGVAALVTVTAWASAFIGIRDAGEEISAGALSLGRLLDRQRRARLDRGDPARAAAARSDLPAIAFCGLLWFGIYNVALNEAERHVDAGTAAMLVNVGPILIALLAGVILHEGFPRSLLRLGRRVRRGDPDRTGDLGRRPRRSGGAALCLVAASAYAGGVVSQKPVLARVSALQVTFLACVVGAIACLPFGPKLVDELGTAGGSSVPLDDLPRPRADGAGLHDLGVRAVAHHGGRMGATTSPCRRSRSSWPG